MEVLNILEALSYFAKVHVDKEAWSFLDDSGNVVDSFTYAELDQVSTILAAHIRIKCGVREGERALLVFFPGLHFTISLLACFKAKIIAVPVFPPDPRRLKKDLDHFVSIQTSSEAKVALTHAPYNFAKKVSDVKALFHSSGNKTSWPDLNWLQVDSIIDKAKSAKRLSNKSVPSSLDFVPATTFNDGDIAFLQYTSGSTSEPKGVIISHKNLSHNLSLIIKELQADNSTVCVSWLPQYHDMGLIGSYLGTIYCGGTGYYLSPISFLKDPNIWLKCISRYSGTHTQAPNFAYPLASRKFDEWLSENKKAPDLNLKSLRHMINAAEPVDIGAISDFYRTFEKYGLPRDVIFPTYGLAEHTVFVCSDGRHVLTVDKNSLELGCVLILSKDTLSSFIDTKMTNNSKKLPLSAQYIVGCGYPGKGDGVDVCIVDPETCALVESRKVGEIWVNSPSKAMGYWHKPEQSEEAFQATVLTPDLEANRRYLRTGDLGFMYQGELFICGRLKDLIIVRGGNHYPQDLERVAEAAVANAIRPGCSAAFAVSHQATHTESVVLVAELRKKVPPAAYVEIATAVRKAVAAAHGLTLSVIVFLAERTIEKTTSGKIARARCRRAYLEGTLQALYKWSAADAQSGAGDEFMLDEAGTSLDPVPEGEETVSFVRQGHNNNDPLVGISKDELREMSLSTIADRLEQALVKITAQSSSPIQAPIDRDSPLIAIGVDSLTIIQVKGVLEKKFFCDVPDEFAFSQQATINELAQAVKHGGLTAEQHAAVVGPGGPSGDSAVAAAGVSGGRGTGGRDPNSHVVQQASVSQPLCPWFTCCY